MLTITIFFRGQSWEWGEKCFHIQMCTYVYIYMYSTYIYTDKENKLKAPDISNIILYCVVFIHTHNTGMPCFIVLYFIAVCRYYCLFDWLKVCGSTLCWSVAAISQQHLLSMSLSQFGNFCNIPNFLIIIIIFFLVTPKQMVVIWWHHKLCPYKMADLVNKCVFLLPCQAAILRLSLSSGLLVPWDKTTLGWGQLITLQWPLSMQVKGRGSRRSL